MKLFVAYKSWLLYIKVGCCILKLVVVYKLNEIGNEYIGQENLVGLWQEGRSVAQCSTKNHK